MEISNERSPCFPSFNFSSGVCIVLGLSFWNASLMALPH